MSFPPCFHLADEVFPRVRGEAARRLRERGWSQSRAAHAIGVSQAMVSKYEARPPDDDPTVLRLTEELIADLDAPSPRTGPAPWCLSLSSDRHAGLDAAMADVLAAERALRDHAPLALVPQIGLNLARALPEATTEDHVLSYAGRIIAVGDALVSPAPPTLGASGHLARCLLAHRNADPSIHALASIAGTASAAQAAGRIGTVERLGPEGDRERLYAAAACPGVTLIHDPGAFGIEPCLYVAGPDARTVAHTILRIHEEQT